MHTCFFFGFFVFEHARFAHAKKNIKEILVVFFLLVGVETQGGFFFFSHALHFRFVVVSGASLAFVVVVVVVVVVVGREVGGAVFGKVIALLVVSAGFGVLGGAGVEGFDAMFIVFLSPFGPYKLDVKAIETKVVIP